MDIESEEIEVLEYLEEEDGRDVPARLVYFARRMSEKGWLVRTSVVGSRSFYLGDTGRSIFATVRHRKLKEEIPSDWIIYKAWEEVPARFRDGGKLGGKPLTVEYVKGEGFDRWNLCGSYITKHFGEGKTLTTRAKVGRTYAYLYRELLALRDQKTENQKDK